MYSLSTDGNQPLRIDKHLFLRPICEIIDKI